MGVGVPHRSSFVQRPRFITSALAETRSKRHRDTAERPPPADSDLTAMIPSGVANPLLHTIAWSAMHLHRTTLLLFFVLNTHYPNMEVMLLQTKL